MSKVTLSYDFIEGQPLTTDFYLEITLPPEVALPSEDEGEFESLVCTPAWAKCSVSSSGKIKITFNHSETITSPLQIEIDSLENPPSTAPSSSFKVDLYSLDDYLIAYQHNKLALSATQGSKLESVALVRSSVKNGA